VVQAHAQEMILPAKYANVIRGLADGGATGGGGGGDAGPNIHFNVHAMDAKSVHAFFKEHSATIGKTVAREYSRFNTAMR
jgi:hypothetical protein